MFGSGSRPVACRARLHAGRGFVFKPPAQVTWMPLVAAADLKGIEGANFVSALTPQAKLGEGGRVLLRVLLSVAPRAARAA